MERCLTGMIEIIISKDTVQYAQNKLNEIHVNSKRGLTNFGSEKERILVGYIGERIVMDFLDIKVDTDDYDYDLVGKLGSKLEVKTITCSFKPKPDYWCTVN